VANSLPDSGSARLRSHRPNRIDRCYAVTSERLDLAEGTCENLIMRHCFRLLLIVALVSTARDSARGQNIAFNEERPFVVGVVPVVGRRSVGGVSVDSNGVVARAEAGDIAALRDARRAALDGSSEDISRRSTLRKVSLSKLNAILERYASQNEPLPADVLCLAGLQRIEYAFAYPEANDIVLAGPAEGWRVDEAGNVVGEESGASVLQLTDLIAALRTIDDLVAGELISCSIDPTAEGLQRFSRLMQGSRGSPSAKLLKRMEQAVGPQSITLTGVPPDTHFAHVLVAADWQMKRLGMGLATSPVAGLPSYLELLAESPGSLRSDAMPRWWIAYGERPVERDAEGLGWRISPPGIRVCTAARRLQADGQMGDQNESDPLSQRWADAMTEHFDELALAEPVFGQVRGCMDLALVTAVLASGDLLAHVGLELSMIDDEKRLQLATYEVPTTVASHANALRGRREWVVCVSGGVDLDVGRVVNDATVAADVRETRKQSSPRPAESWWWD